MMQSQQIPMTFQRYETKYMLSPIMARKLRKSLPGHLQMDEYGFDIICSLYYDTPDHQLIRRSLEKPVYKEKLRLRSYGPAKETSPIYVELKKKYEGIVYKRRERMILSEAVPYLAGKSEPGWYLMEVKSPGAVPLWFSKILDDLAIYPASFSKYGFAYQIENQKASEEKAFIPFTDIRQTVSKTAFR